jgi:hypothetical protein
MLEVGVNYKPSLPVNFLSKSNLSTDVISIWKTICLAQQWLTAYYLATIH